MEPYGSSYSHWPPFQICCSTGVTIPQRKLITFSTPIFLPPFCDHVLTPPGFMIVWGEYSYGPIVRKVKVIFSRYWRPNWSQEVCITCALKIETVSQRPLRLKELIYAIHIWPIALFFTSNTCGMRTVMAFRVAFVTAPWRREHAFHLRGYNITTSSFLP